jgi:hypothetical protein
MRERPGNYAIVVTVAVIVIALLAVWIGANVITNGGGDEDEAEQLTDRDVFGPEAPDNTRDERMSRETCASEDSIAWHEAVDYVGNEVALSGPVLEVNQGGEGGAAATIVVGERTEDAPPLVDIALTATAEGDYAEGIEQVFGGKEVCVIGVIQSSEGRFQIVINESEDIVLL